MALPAPASQAVFDALSSPVRRDILWLTWGEELSAGEIGAHFALSGPTLSSHLAVLREAGLVRQRVDGTFRRYRCDHDAVRALVPLLASGDARWTAADDLPERGLARAARSLVVTVEAEAPVAPEVAYRAFADPERYTAWLGVPVTIRDGRFRATMEWGTEIRGVYDVLSPPELIAMRWDFDDEAVPVPGEERTAYLRVHPTPTGSRVVVHQLAEDERAAEFLTAAWTMVLGRFVEGHPGEPAPPVRRAARPKRRG